ncbi:hypothetical protein HWV62_41836 [Athelia sp. TMB]|nr:hypothetical protein HWV62_41836 [Athelia sp. TMB]
MASASDGAEGKSYEIAVVRATVISRLRLTIGKDIIAYVQIDAADKSWSTKGVPWTKDGDLQWDDRFTLLPLLNSAKIVFSLYRNSRLGIMRPKLLVGRLEVKLAELLEMSIRARRLGEQLSVSLQHKNQPAGQLTIQIQDASTDASASAIERLTEVTEGLQGSRITAAADALSTAGDATKSSLVGSFTSLMESMNIMLADPSLGESRVECAECGLQGKSILLSLWVIVELLRQVVKAQQERDNKITQLVETMQSTYSIVIGSQNLKADKHLQDVLDRILKHTVDCGFFIQNYTRRSFADRTIMEPFSGTDGLISRYQDTFKQLRDDYIGRTSTYTALVSCDIAATVNRIRFNQEIEKLRPVMLDQSERGTCLPNTRLDAIKSISDWYADDSDDRENVMWVYGLAGAGKSTLATTIAQMMDGVDGINLLGAFFFFDRDIPERNAATMIRTIAYQLAQFDPIIGAKIEQVITNIPNIANMSLALQFLKLLSATALGDIQWTRGPVLVIIDALDESSSGTGRKNLLQVLSEGFFNLPHFLRLLVVSRPERDIVDGFEHSIIRRVELGVDSTRQSDIAEFIRTRLLEIRMANMKYLAEVLLRWPTEDEIRALAVRAAGLFIWAATACRLIDESHHPKEKMNELIEHHSVASYGTIFTSLYRLYKDALQSAGNWNDESFCRDFQDILGTIVCAQVPLSCVALDCLLGLPRPSMLTISRLGSVLRGSREEPIRILHTSFHDYLTLDDLIEPWAINNEQYNAFVADRCLTHLEQMLHENMCNLTLPHPLQAESLSVSVSYASKFWIEHVCATQRLTDNLCDRIFKFLQIHLLHWMETLVVMRAYDVALRSLPKLLRWIQALSPGGQLHHFVHDAHRFAQHFANTIQEHPLSIYYSALPFTPYGTQIYKTFYHNNLPRVVSGVERQWSNLLQVLRGHTDVVNAVVISPDGSKIASCSDDSTVRVWNALTGQEALPPLQGHEYPVECLAFSPDGSKILSGSYDGTIRLWNAYTGELKLPILLGHERGVTSVAFSPDGSRIVSGSDDQTVRMWNALDGQEALSPLQGHELGVHSVAFSPDGCKIASGSLDRTIRLWDALTGELLLPPLQGHEGYVESVVFSPDGTMIISGSADKTIRSWNVLSGQEVMPQLRGRYWIKSVAFSHNGSKIIASSDCEIRVWDAHTREETLPPIRGIYIQSAMFSPDESKILGGTGAGDISVWDALDVGRDLQPLQGHKDRVMSAAFSSDGSKIVSGSSDKTARVWDTLTGEQMFLPFTGHEEPVGFVAFSTDGCRVASSSDSTVCIWNTLTGEPSLPPISPQCRGFGSKAAIFSPDGSQIICRSDDTVKLWDAFTGQPLPPLRISDDLAPLLPGRDQLAVTSVAVSPNGRNIVSGWNDGTLRVWDTITGKQALAPLRGHEQGIQSVAFSSDGYKIVSGSLDRTIRVWNMLTGQQILPPLLNHNEIVSSVSFSPDDCRIISFSNWTLSTRVWDAITGKEVSLESPQNFVTAATSSAQGEIHDSAVDVPIEPRKLVYLEQHGYFTEVNAWRALSKIPVDSFEVDKRHVVIKHLPGDKVCVLAWRKLSVSNYVPLIIYLNL